MHSKKEKELSEEHKTNVNNLKACDNILNPCNATLSNSDSSLWNHPVEAIFYSENNISVIENLLFNQLKIKIVYYHLMIKRNVKLKLYGVYLV